MNFQTHNDKTININDSWLQGEINDVSYSELVKKFGKPTESDGYKSDAEWEVEGEDGTIATIYNWKDGKNYCGKDGLSKTKITNWHIGGSSQKSVEMVKEILRLNNRL